MFQCNRLDLTSSSTITSVKRYGNAFPHQKNVSEHRSHTFPPHYNPGHVTGQGVGSTLRSRCRVNF